MRVNAFAVAVAITLCTTASAFAQDAAVAVKDGGIFAKGWTGKIDAQEEKAGQVLNNARFEEKNGVISVRTGPAVTYWNPANTAAGNYTVSATFTEPKYMNLMEHPHPYGIMIAGNDLGTDNQSYIYCSAYGNGTFIVRGMGPAPFQVSARKPEPNAAINKAAGKNEPVKQDIALSVNGDTIECAINGTVVGSYKKADVVAAGKLKSTDGVYGLRFAHNTEATVTNFKMTKK
ncbi:MAG TPA: hypothetical protein VEC39_00025 [Vicinamibacterales bacterium]|nr:hypothetical protein [Vicinamibacterales bacterium]